MSTTIQLTVFDIDDRQFGVPLDRTERVVRAADPTPLPHAPEIVLGAIDLHGTIIPVLSVRHRLGLPHRPMGVDDQFIIVRTSRRVVALLVDRVRDIVSCPAEGVVPAGAVLAGWDQVRGIVQLQGGLILIQDLDLFLSLQEDQLLEDSLREKARDGK
jgi:purine-binding chemotaxis protein CheW